MAPCSEARNNTMREDLKQGLKSEEKRKLFGRMSCVCCHLLGQFCFNTSVTEQFSLQAKFMNHFLLIVTAGDGKETHSSSNGFLLFFSKFLICSM